MALLINGKSAAKEKEGTSAGNIDRSTDHVKQGSAKECGISTSYVVLYVIIYPNLWRWAQVIGIHDIRSAVNAIETFIVEPSGTLGRLAPAVLGSTMIGTPYRLHYLRGRKPFLSL